MANDDKLVAVYSVPPPLPDKDLPPLQTVSDRLQVVESSGFHAIVAGLSVLESLICLYALAEPLYDTASPSPVRSNTRLIDNLNTDNAFFTIQRQTLLIASVCLRIIFLVEVAMRIAAKGVRSFMSDTFDVVDALIVLTAIPLKIGLHAREALVASMLISVRISRVWKIFVVMNDQAAALYHLERTQIEQHLCAQIEKERRRVQRLTTKLETANSKLKVLLGEEVVQDYEENYFPEFEPVIPKFKFDDKRVSRVSRLTFMNLIWTMTALPPIVSAHASRPHSSASFGSYHDTQNAGKTDTFLPHIVPAAAATYSTLPELPQTHRRRVSDQRVDNSLPAPNTLGIIGLLQTEGGDVPASEKAYNVANLSERVGSSQQQRRLRRSGWWSSSSDKLDQINRIKEILHQKPLDTHPSTPSSMCSESRSAFQPLANEHLQPRMLRTATPKLSPVLRPHTPQAAPHTLPATAVTLPSISQNRIVPICSNQNDGNAQHVHVAPESDAKERVQPPIHRHTTLAPTQIVAPAAESDPSTLRHHSSAKSQLECQKEPIIINRSNAAQKQDMPTQDTRLPNTVHSARPTDNRIQLELDAACAQITDLQQKLSKAEKRAEFSAKAKKSLTHLHNAINDIKAESSTKRVPSRSLLKHFWRHGFKKTLVAFIEELGADAGPSACLSNYIILKQAIDAREFTQAIVLVQSIMSRVIDDARKAKTTTSLVPSFEDLIYVLSKYLLIQMHQRRQQSAAIETLEHVIAPLVKREQKRGGVRAEWFATDYTLLHQLIHNTSNAQPSIYTDFDWDIELEKFWSSASLVRDDARASTPSTGRQGSRSTLRAPPLFAFALAEHFYVDEEWFLGVMDLETAMADAERWSRAQETIELCLQDIAPARDKARPSRSGANRSSAQADAKDSSLVHQDCSKSVIVSSKDTQLPPPTPEAPPPQHRPQASRRTWRNSQPGAQGGARQDKMSVSSTSVSAGHVHHSSLQQPELEPLALADPNETTDFALSAVCGPSISHVRVLDVCVIADSGQVIVATAGSENRLDKGISIWDVRDGSLIAHLDNGTIKPIVGLIFHPGFPELLLSADMEFDVKLWNWREGKTVRWWRKHHSRIIYRLAWVPGDDTRAASCSGDQSLKIWNIHAQKALSGSIHANEPITSFVFCGNPNDPAQQKIVISLSFSIRIYKLRTLSMLVNIPLADLKMNKTPVTSLASHPLFETLILVSTDNQLRLFDMTTQSFVRAYSSRMIESGTRIGGDFSPGGSFVYAGATDIRHMPSRRLRPSQAHDDGPFSASGSNNVTNSRIDASNDVSIKNRGDGSAELSGVACGIFLWRTVTGKLEQADMKAMDATDEWEHCGIPVRACPILASKWFVFRDHSRKGQVVERKAMIAAGTDKLIRMYI